MLEVKNLVYKTLENTLIIDNFNLKFDNGINVITGFNGSGKTTLSKLIMGILLPTSGEIFLDDKNITELNITERANLGISLAFQQPILFKGISVKNLLDIANKKENNVSEACTLLSTVGLCARDYLSREFNNTLSGGELKRLELALALAKGGKVFIFDEPEAGIDIWSFDELIKIFKNLSNKTVIIISHNKKIIELADKVVVLNKNKPIECDSNTALKIITENSCGAKGGKVWTK